MSDEEEWDDDIGDTEWAKKEEETQRTDRMTLRLSRKIHAMIRQHVITTFKLY